MAQEERNGGAEGLEAITFLLEERLAGLDENREGLINELKKIRNSANDVIKKVEDANSLELAKEYNEVGVRMSGVLEKVKEKEGEHEPESGSEYQSQLQKELLKNRRH